MKPSENQPELQGFQRKYLRKLAHSLKPVVQVGEAGVSSALLRALGDALLDHELVKVRLRAPEDKRQISRELAQHTESHLCGLVGHTAILYKPHPGEPRIDLPTRGEE